MYEPILTERVMRAFNAELAKTAGAAEALMSHLSRPGVRNAIGAGAGSGLGLGLGAGALIGGARGGKDAYDAARGRGEGRGSAALHALLPGMGGAARGAGKGALIGAGSGALLGAALPTKVLSATKGLAKMDNSLGSLSNFGQRQVHSLTGWKPGGAAHSVERIGEGAAPARRELMAELKKGVGEPAKVERASKALAATEEAQRMGLTSLPGIGRSVRDNGILKTVGTGVKAQWAGAGPKSKALMVGLPALSMANAALSQEGEGPGRAERLGRIAGGTLGGVAAPLSVAGSLALSTALERGGGAVGKGIDKLRRKKPQAQQPPQVPRDASRPPATEPGDTGQHSVEHVYGTGFTGAQGGLE